MLLPKRKRVKKSILPDLPADEFDREILKRKVDMQEPEDSYLLDSENAIIVVDNDDKSEHDESYIMIHERIIDGELKEINRWYIDCYYFGSIHDVTVIEDLKLFQVQNGAGCFNALYNYETGKFVVPRGEWKEVFYHYGNVNYLNKYNGFIATFSINSDYEDDDCCTYVNPVTNETITESFSVYDGSYYAILNIDGSIRSNKLFKGTSFSRIEEVIDLNQYDSLESFKIERKKLCNEEKNRRKQQYYQLKKSGDNDSVSLYKDSEVLKVLELKK